MRGTILKYRYKRSAPIIIEHTSICTGTLIKNTAKMPLIHEIPKMHSGHPAHSLAHDSYTIISIRQTTLDTEKHEHN